MPTPEEIDNLLYDACVELGFCLKPSDQDRIAQLGDVTAHELAVQIVKAEGVSDEAYWIKRLERFIAERQIS